jgi:hypothetical protein
VPVGQKEVTIPTTATTPLNPQHRAAYQVQPHNSAPAQIGTITTVTRANPLPNNAITLSKDGRIIPPATANTASKTLIAGLKNFLRRSHFSWAISSGSRVWGMEGPGSEDDDGAGEFGRVVYRGVGTELGT